MPDDVKQVEVKQVEVKIDWKLAKEKLKQIEDKVLEYAGKTGFNPHLWLRSKGFSRIREKLNRGVELNEDYDFIMKSSFEIPVAPGCSPEDKPSKV